MKEKNVERIKGKVS